MRKTKKQKLRAELRRKQDFINLADTNQDQPGQLGVDLKEIAEKFTPSSLPKVIDKKVADKTEDYSYLSSDLKKLALIASAGITIQILLHLTLVWGYVNLVRNWLQIEAD